MKKKKLKKNNHRKKKQIFTFFTEFLRVFYNVKFCISWHTCCCSCGCWCFCTVSDTDTLAGPRVVAGLPQLMLFCSDGTGHSSLLLLFAMGSLLFVLTQLSDSIWIGFFVTSSAGEMFFEYVSPAMGAAAVMLLLWWWWLLLLIGGWPPFIFSYLPRWNPPFAWNGEEEVEIWYESNGWIFI